MSDFPGNIIDEYATALAALNLFDHILKRPIRPNDPHLSCGIFPVLWTPNEMQIGQYDPALSTYNFQVQTFVKHANEEEGTALHIDIAKSVRVMIYRDDSLRQSLGALNATENGIIERYQRGGVIQQRFLANEVQGQFLFVAVTEIFAQTEMV